MLGILQDLFEMVSSLFDFAFCLIKDLLSVANMLSKLILDIPVWLELFLPPSIAGLFVVVLSVTVIYRIAGRD